MSQLQLRTSSPYTWYYLSVILDLKELFNFNCQPQEEAGSAGGQPASNKADGDDCRSGLMYIMRQAVFDQSEPFIAKKTHRQCYPTTHFW